MPKTLIKSTDMSVPAASFPFSRLHCSKSRIKVFKEQDWLNENYFFIVLSFCNLIKPLNSVLDTRNISRRKRVKQKGLDKICLQAILHVLAQRESRGFFNSVAPHGLSKSQGPGSHVQLQLRILLLSWNTKNRFPQSAGEEKGGAKVLV